MEGFNGGIPQQFFLELYETRSKTLVTNVTSESSSFHVIGLEPGFSFSAHVYAYNNKGQSEVRVVPVYTMRLPEKILTRGNGMSNLKLNILHIVTLSFIPGKTVA